MQKIIKPYIINGELNAPPSKSLMQRAVAAALLCEGETVISNSSFCNDALSALDISRKLGATISIKGSEVLINGGFKIPATELDCGESGLALRMFSPIASLHSTTIKINGTGSLLKRPASMIANALESLGVNVKTNNGLLPLEITGPLKGGNTVIDGSVSSQLLTGLLMALPVAEYDSQLIVHNLKSKAYIDMTIDLLSSFNIQINKYSYNSFYIKGRQTYIPCHYIIEGDWSGASFLLTAAALNGYIRINNINNKSRQPDKAIVDILKQAGAKVHTGEGFIEVEKNALNAFDFDATGCPDLFPPLVALAAHCKGVTHLKGALRLEYKESNRADVLQTEFAKAGVKIDIDNDDMYIHGGKVKGGKINSHNDHRIAMAASVLAAMSENGTEIENAECVAKSYPAFFEDIEKVTF